MVGLASVEGARWDFFNHQRLFELGRALNINFRKLARYQDLRRYRMVREDGLIASPTTWTVGPPSFRLYDVYEGLYLYFYVKDVLERVLASLPLIDLTNCWSRSEIETLVNPNSWIALQSAFYFKKLVDTAQGRNQRRRGFRRRDGIEVTFEFDAWDSTSSSSQQIHLRGYQTALVILHLRSVERTDGCLRLSGSCLAIGTGFSDGRLRVDERPPPSVLRRRAPADGDEEEGLEV
jgi:hypothetical protein